MTEHEKPQLSGNNLHLNVHFHINARLLFLLFSFFYSLGKKCSYRGNYTFCFTILAAAAAAVGWELMEDE